MKLLNGIADRARKNQKLVNAYLAASFFWSIPPRDLRDLQKLKLLLTARRYTMAGYRRLENVYQLAQAAVREELDGAFVECGVWRGGCAGVMARIAKDEGAGRITWLFDSFEGLPEPSGLDGEWAHEYASQHSGGSLVPIDRCVADIDWARQLLFDKLDVDEHAVRFGVGWFQDVLPQATSTVGPIGLLRLDGDWYESTRCCLEHLYDNVVPGGFVIIDDYGHWQGCRTAVNEFFDQRSITVELKDIDYTGRYFRKP
jgi:hypothetical protein